MTNREVVEAGVGLRRIFEAQAPFKFTYRLEKIARKILKLMAAIEEERVRLCKVYGEKQADGSFKVVGRMEEFADSYNAILGREATIEFEPIPRELVEGLEISAVELTALSTFLAEEVK